jgi:phosphohistidine phosphatase
MRHAKSSWSDGRLSDHDRPLKKRGARDALKMGRMLSERGLEPDLIISSSAKRAMLTAEEVASVVGYDEEIQVTRQFYLADPLTFIDWLGRSSDECDRIMIVGHNPGMEDLVEELTGVWERMPTAAVANIRLQVDSWSELEASGECELIDLWRPREL